MSIVITIEAARYARAILPFCELQVNMTYTLRELIDNENISKWLIGRPVSGSKKKKNEWKQLNDSNGSFSH